MLTSLFPFFYGIVVLVLLWQAFRIMGRGFTFGDLPGSDKSSKHPQREDRTGRITVHPELLDQDGRITEEELLTVRFSEDTDPPQSAETSAE